MTLPGMPGNKKIGWSASGDLITGDSIKQVTLQADFPIPDVYTVEFNLTDNPTPSIQVATRAEAFITWSVEGNNVTRRVNVGNGISVTGVGQACRVVINDTTDKITFPAGLGKPYNVSMNLSRGPRAATTQQPTLLPFPGAQATDFLVAPGFPVSVPVPLDAGVTAVCVFIVGFAPLPEFAPVVVHTNGGATNFAQYDPRQEFWVPVIPGTRIIKVGTATPDSFVATVLFGIDG